MTWFLLLGLSFASGFVSLSYEILWSRMFSWTTAGSPAAFPMLLGLFLAGIALGAKWSKRFTKGEATFSPKALRVLAALIAGGAIAGWLVVPGMARLLSLPAPIPGFTGLYFVFGAACIFGAQLPLLMHYGISPDERVGIRLSYLYVANITGSVAGSLITGFIWLDHMSTAEISATLTLIGLILSVGLYSVTAPPRKQLIGTVLASLLVSATVLGANRVVYADTLERLYYGPKYEGQTFKYVIETKSGLIAVEEGDIAIGGGVYDGMFSTDVIDDKNGTRRPFSLSAFHPHPKTVLVIGLATGSWARVLAEHPQVEKVTIIEINRGYFDLIKEYPSSAKLLNHPKVELIEDDARRWMNANAQRFDAIVSNTSFHQRNFASTLLSQEFMNLLKSHLNPNGVVMINTTGSNRAYKTALTVFGHCIGYLRSAICTDHPIVADTERLKSILMAYRIDGKQVVDAENPRHLTRIAEIVSEMKNEDEIYISSAKLQAISKDFDIITDSNMGHEWQFEMMGLGEPAID